MNELIHIILHEIEHTLTDTYILIPLLFIVYLILEYLEHTHKLDFLNKIHLNPFIGSLIGIIPQCGFSVISSILFLENKITLGTLISIYISTSDEGLTLLFASKGISNELIYLILIKVFIGTIIGYLVDRFIKHQEINTSIKEHKHDSSSLIIEALKHTIIVYGFIFIVDMILCLFIEYIGHDLLSLYLMSDSILQPLISSIIGFIPHCASSILLIELYTSSIISYASLVAGLITNGGLGLITLIQYKTNIKMILKICIILLVSSLILTIPMQWFYLL